MNYFSILLLSAESHVFAHRAVGAAALQCVAVKYTRHAPRDDDDVGVTLVERDATGAFRLKHVRPQSVAAVAGVRPGDVLLAINNMHLRKDMV